MICELARYSIAAESCTADATHDVITQLGGDRGMAESDPVVLAARGTYQLCAAHAGGAYHGQHRSPAVPGEVVTTIPGVA